MKGKKLILLLTALVVVLAAAIAVVIIKRTDERKAHIVLAVADGYVYNPSMNSTIVNSLTRRIENAGAKAQRIEVSETGGVDIVAEDVADVALLAAMLEPEGRLEFRRGVNSDLMPSLLQAIDSIDCTEYDPTGSQPKLADWMWVYENDAKDVFGKETLTYTDREGPELGIFSVADTAAVNAILDAASKRGELPSDIDFAWALMPDMTTEGQFVKLNCVYADRLLDGSYVTKAEALESMGQNVINIEMDADGAHMWKNITDQSIGQPIAILVDGKFVSAPVVNDVIEGGRSQITGSFTTEEAAAIASAVGAPANAVGMRVVEAAYVK